MHVQERVDPIQYVSQRKLTNFLSNFLKFRNWRSSATFLTFVSLLQSA